jgi:hypothetical protein
MRNLKNIINHFNTLPISKNFSINKDLIINHSKDELNLLLQSISKENPNKKIIVFFLIDYEFELNIPENVLVLRTSMRNSIKSPREYILPYIWEPSNKIFNLLPNGTQPIVGFCGQVNKYRTNILNSTYVNPIIKTNFILRKYFFGGTEIDKNISKKDLINDFYKNMEESHFIICNRGSGNFTMRFYQALSAGRIPILVNTDMLLPFTDRIPWRELIIIEDNEQKVIEKVIEWWKFKNLALIQSKCAEIYYKYFTHTNFIDNVINLLP